MSTNFDKLIERTFQSLISEQDPEESIPTGQVQGQEARADEIEENPNATPEEKRLAELQRDAKKKQEQSLTKDVEDLENVNKDLDDKAERT